MPLNVIIVGAGLGGLTLAQGLHAAGVDVAVYEKDPHPYARGQGYRIHLDPEADRLLRACLPPLVYRLYRETSGLSSGRTLLMTDQLKILNSTDHHQGTVDDAVVDRLTFRQALYTGLDGVIHHGKPFTHYELRGPGQVRAHFADGSTADADVLIGADGAGSTVRRQLLPEAPTFDSGLRLIYGKTPLTDARRRALPDQLVGGFAIVTAPDRRGMALGWHEYRTDPNLVAERLGVDVKFPDTGDYLMWGLTLPTEDLPTNLTTAAAETSNAPDGDAGGVTDGGANGVTGGECGGGASGMTGGGTGNATGGGAGGVAGFGGGCGEGLLSIACERVSGWHPVLREVVAGVSVSSLVVLPLRTSLPVAAWPAGPVTLLGDAAHAMFPAGSGTLVALRDAGHLLAALRGAVGAVGAVAEYVRVMFGYAWSDVRESYFMAERLGGRSWPHL